MSEWRPFVFSLTLLTVLLGTAGLLLRRALPPWWARRWVRRLYAALCFAAVAVLATWTFGIAVGDRGWSAVGIRGAWLVFAYAFPLAVGLGGSALVMVPARLLAKRTPARATAPAALRNAGEGPAARAPDGEPALGRRQLVQAVAASFPVGAVATSTAGLWEGSRTPGVPRIPVLTPGLPPGLEGLRVLQLTDLHLGFFFRAPDVERFLASLAPADQPDLIVFTGDIADDLRELGPVLRIASERRPRLGVLGVVGNHEHFRGLPAVRRVFDASPVPLLFNGGTALPVAGSTLHVAGIDDPGVRRLGDEEHFARTIDAALDGAPSDAFHLLLSHRPEGFDVAARRGVHLTLAGHTHGGQVGIGGRSAFEGMTRNRYLWGMYERGPSRLYTSAGFGHWMPVRLGCPREAPLLVLTGGSASG